MGYPRSRSRFSRLSSAVFWLSLLGIVGSMLFLAWAFKLKMGLGDHMDLAVPGGEGYLWPGTTGLAVVIVAPVHVLGLMVVRTGIEGERRNSNGRYKSSVDRLLSLYTLLSCMSSLLVLSACAGSAYFWNLSRRRVRSGLNRAIRRYPSQSLIKTRVDRLQIELGCCGVESYVDWFFVNWEEHVYEDDNDAEYTDLNYSLDEPRHLVSTDVPYSCCSAEAAEACVHQSIAQTNREAETDDEPTISGEGCENKLLERADETARKLLVSLLVKSAYQLTLSILSRLLQAAKLRESTGVSGEESFVKGSRKSPQRRRNEELLPLKADATSENNTCKTSSGESLYAVSSSPEENKRAATSPRMQMTRHSVEPRSNVSSLSNAADDDDEVSLERNFNANDKYGRFRGTLQDTLERRKRCRDSQAVKRAPSLKSSSSCYSTKQEKLRCPVHQKIQPSCCPVHGGVGR